MIRHPLSFMVVLQPSFLLSLEIFSLLTPATLVVMFFLALCLTYHFKYFLCLADGSLLHFRSFGSLKGRLPSPIPLLSPWALCRCSSVCLHDAQPVSMPEPRLPPGRGLDGFVHCGLRPLCCRLCWCRRLVRMRQSASFPHETCFLVGEAKTKEITDTR